MILRGLAVWAALATGAAAQDDPAASATAAVQQLEIASTLLDAAGGRRDRVAALTETVKAYEAGLIAMRDGLRRATIRQQTIEARLAAANDEVAQLLGVLQSMGRAPAPLLLLHPNGPIGTARSGMMAADVTPALQGQVNELRLALEEVALLRDLQASATATLEDGLQGAQDARTALSEAISNRTDLPQRFREDPVQMALLIASTETLDGFAAGLADAALTGVETSGPITNKGDLPLPVQSRLLRGFNAPDAAGISRPGVILAARPRAMVTTPVPATILFRGPLLNYGNVVIIEPQADVMVILAGLAEVYGEAGQVVPADTPLGLLGGDAPSVDAILTQSDVSGGGQASQTLYLEVREGQSPVDPSTWFALE